MRNCFITGFPRSGTTLLANLLNSQKSATIWNNYYAGPLTCAARFGGFLTRLSEQEKNIALSWIKFTHEASHVQVSITTSDFDTIEQIHRLGLRELGKPADTVIGYKLNGFGPHTAVFKKLVEETDTKVICVIRDARDVVLSQSNHLHDHTTSGSQWNTFSQNARKFERHPNVVVIRYEDLVLDTRAALGPIEDLLGIEISLDSDYLLHHEAKWRDNSAFHDVTRLFDPRPVERWREHTGNPLIRRIAYICRQESSRRGYPPFSERFSFREITKYEVNEQVKMLWKLASSAKGRIRKRLLG